MQPATYIFVSVCCLVQKVSVITVHWQTLDFETDDRNADVMLSSIFSARASAVLLMTNNAPYFASIEIVLSKERDFESQHSIKLIFI